MSKQINYAFPGVFIPANVWTNPQLSWLDKFVWAVVVNLHDGSHICHASDQEIADILGDNEMLVTSAVNRLIDLDILHHGTNDGGQRTLWRTGIEFVQAAPTEEAQQSTSMSDVQSIVDIYNECCKTMPRAEKLTPARVRRIRKIVAETKTTIGPTDWFRILFVRAHGSDFLSGRNKAWTGCNIDWILAPANMDKIVEGVYDNRTVNTAPRHLPENLR